jgi:hypothetical protein
MQEMLYPTSYLKSKGLGKACALITDGRFSGGSSGLSIGHISPEAAEGGLIGLVEDGDIIEIDIPNRTIHLAVDDAELKRRRAPMPTPRTTPRWKPAAPRKRAVSTALKAYAAFASSAAKGAVRILPDGREHPVSRPAVIAQRWRVSAGVFHQALFRPSKYCTGNAASSLCSISSRQATLIETYSPPIASTKPLPNGDTPQVLQK